MIDANLKTNKVVLISLSVFFLVFFQSYNNKLVLKAQSNINMEISLGLSSILLHCRMYLS